MYTKYQGIELIQSYFNNRNNLIKQCRNSKSESNTSSLITLKTFQVIKEKLSKVAPEMLELYYPKYLLDESSDFHLSCDSDIDLISTPNSIKNISIDQSVQTLVLLDSLFVSLLKNTHNVINKIWIDHLVQRYEVTKKLYVEYQPGFRKGCGLNNSIKLYWYFAIILIVYYLQTNKIKYLNTLLKVCDLISSLPFNALNRDIPNFGLDLVLSTEIVFVDKLLRAKGI